jgi:prepilin-type processing-associated H-X9-DG protein
MESNNLYSKVTDSEQLADAAAYSIGLFQCPSDPSGPPRYAPSNYAPNYFVFLNVPGGWRGLDDFVNGTANTLAFAERRRNCIDGGGSWSKRDRAYGAWVENTDLFQSEFAFANGGDNSRWHQIHGSGINVLMLDGAVSTRDASVDAATWRTWTQAQPVQFDPKKVLD